MRIFGKLVTANLLEMFRDKMQIFWFLLFPLVFVFVFGLLYSSADRAAGGGSQSLITYEIGIVSGDEVVFNDIPLAGYFERSDLFKVHTGSQEAELQAFKNGKRCAVIVLPDDFHQTIIKGKTSPIKLYYDVKRLEILYVVSEVFNEIERNRNGSSKLVDLKPVSSLQLAQEIERGDQAPEQEGSGKKTSLSQIDYTLPGLLGLTLMQIGLFGSLRILNLKHQRTLRALGTTPMSRSTFLASEICVRLILALIQGGIIIMVGHYVFGLTVTSSWYVVVGWIVIGVSAFIALGYLLGTFVKTPDSGNALLQVVQFPMMFLAGIFFPPEMMPEFLKPVSKIIPLTYLADGLRSSMTGTLPAYGLTLDLLILVATLIVCMALTVVRFTWD